MKNQKVILTVAIILVILIVGGVSWFIVSRNNENTGSTNLNSVVTNTNISDNQNKDKTKEDIIDNLVKELIEDENNNKTTRELKQEIEDKFCLSIDDCIIIDGINEACPSKGAFNKEAIEAHDEFIEDSKSFFCTFEIKPPKKSELVCENNQCSIKYTEL